MNSILEVGAGSIIAVGIMESKIFDHLDLPQGRTFGYF